jgi:excisionase family DNA binding protein
MRGQSHRVGEAADLLGVSVPTVKDLVRKKKLRAFRTPGGQLRVLADSLEELQQGPVVRSPREPSPVLQNKRERVEELGLEAQELRASHEIRKLRQEDAAEARQKREERQESARQAQQEAQRLELERQQLEIERQERAERARAEAALRDFRQRWLAHADKLLNGFLGAFFKYDWLTPQQRKEVAETLEGEIGKHGPDDEQRMSRIIQDTLASFVAPLEAQREIARRREHAVDRMMLKLSFKATDSERVRAEALAREALRQMPLDASADELLMKAQDAIAPISRAIQDREAREKREATRDQFIRSAFVTVASYKQELRDQDEISRQDCSDQALWDEINEDVRDQLSRELTGDESPQEVEGLIRRIVDEAFDLESPEEDQG